METDIVTGYIDYEGYIDQSIFYGFQSREDKEEVVNRYLHTYLNEKLFITKVEEITVSLSEGKVDIIANAFVNIPILGGLFEENLDSNLHYAADDQVNARKFVRLFDVFGGVIDKVPNSEAAMESLQKVLQTVK